MPKKSTFDFIDYDCDLDLRLLYIGSQHVSIHGTESGVDAALFERVAKGLRLLNARAPAGDKPIHAILNNPGGDTVQMLALYDIIKESPNPVHIQVYGMAASAASVILQASKHRFLSPNARVMIHLGTTSVDGHVKNVNRWIEEGKKVDKLCEDIYLERIQEKNPLFTRSQLKKLLEFDTILSASEAIELGLADGLIE